MRQEREVRKDNGGYLIAEVLERQGVKHLFTLCGGHISPILVGAKSRGIRIIDVRDERNAVFAADAVARMTGIPGVAAVTAGPGVTNTLTAVKNAQMAQSPIIIFGGATATVLKGRGSLQDIEQLPLMKPITKWATTVKLRSQLQPTVEKAFEVSKSGIPGPVFIEVPIDLLYDEAMVREWYMKDSGVQGNDSLGAKALKLYLEAHLLRQFKSPRMPEVSAPEISMPSVAEIAAEMPPPEKDAHYAAQKVASLLSNAKKPVLVIGSQALVNFNDARAAELAEAVKALGIPTYLGGTARGLLGRHNEIQFRHARARALKEADVALVLGFPFDFRLGYGRSISKKATLVAVNLSAVDLRKNRRPEVAVQVHPGEFLLELERATPKAPDRTEWFAAMRKREAARDEEIAKGADATSAPLEPVNFFLRLEEKMADDAVLVVDGGDFVATGSYILRPRAPLSWLDPGVFGTLGVGGGFAAGAAAVRTGKEVWLIYGDGSSAYSLNEFDTFARHGLAPIAVIGNDGAWNQIARDQVEFLGDSVGTVLTRNDYHLVAEGYGGKGFLLTDPKDTDRVLEEAKTIARSGKPVCINVHIARSDFRKGSLSM